LLLFKAKFEKIFLFLQCLLTQSFALFVVNEKKISPREILSLSSSEPDWVKTYSDIVADESNFPFHFCDKKISCQWKEIAASWPLFWTLQRDEKSFLSLICLIYDFLKHHCAQERWQEPLWKGEATIYFSVTFLEKKGGSLNFKSWQRFYGGKNPCKFLKPFILRKHT